MSIQQSIVTLIADTAAKHGDLPALCIADRSYSYEELVSAANGIQQAILNVADNQQTRIGVITGDDFETYASLLAILSCGKAYVPLNRMSPPARNLAIATQAKLDIVLSSTDLTHSDTASALKDVARIVETNEIAPIAGALRIFDIVEDDLAYLFFTSGSTGVPKGVPIRHRQLNSYMQSVISECDYEFSSNDRFLQMFELTFDLSVMSIFTPWCVGACCYVVPEKGISYLNIIDILEKHRITVALMVPSALSYMRRFFEEISFPDLRLSLFCGEALHHDLVAAWSKSVPNAHIENVYGPTEATIFCLRYVWTQSESAAESVNGIVPIGEAMPRLRTYVVDEAGQLCDDGQKGELCLSGDQVMTEYWEDPAKTETAFVSVPAENETERAYRTGDIAYSNQNGNLIYLGRLDSQIKIDGHRIELSEIEHFACKCIKSAMAVAVVSDDDLGQPEIILYVQKGDYEINDVESFLASMLPGYMLPRKICGIVEMPLNLNGKIDRKKLAAMVV